MIINAEQVRALSDIDNEIAERQLTQEDEAIQIASELARVAFLLDQGDSVGPLFLREMDEVASQLDQGRRLTPFTIDASPLLCATLLGKGRELVELLDVNTMRDLELLLRGSNEQTVLSERAGKPRRQIRMDVILAVSLFSRLHYDADIVVGTGQAPDESKKRGGEVFVVRMAEEAIVSKELVDRRAELLTQKGRRTMYERRIAKLKSKYDDIFGGASEYTYILEDAHRYVGGTRGDFESVQRPMEILASIKDIESTNWTEIIFNLRALALCENTEELDEMREALEVE